jgi:hypothetical protein
VSLRCGVPGGSAMLCTSASPGSWRQACLSPALPARLAPQARTSDAASAVLGRVVACSRPPQSPRPRWSTRECLPA